MKKLVIIPAYNEQGGIEKTVQDVLKYAPDFDYVIINDCSVDDTLEVCRKNNFHVINLPVNLGIGGSVQTGYVYAWRNGYDIAVQFDGDGQHRPQYIEAMRKKMDEGYEIVIGSRFLEDKKDWSLRMVGSRLITAAIRLTTGVRVSDPTSGMRMFDRKMIREFALNLNSGPEPDTVSYLLKQGARIAEVPVTIAERSAGESYLKPLVAVRYMVRILISILLIQNFRYRPGL